MGRAVPAVSSNLSQIPRFGAVAKEPTSLRSSGKERPDPRRQLRQDTRRRAAPAVASKAEVARSRSRSPRLALASKLRPHSGLRAPSKQREPLRRDAPVRAGLLPERVSRLCPSMPRKELQELAKIHGVKANQSSDAIREQLSSRMVAPRTSEGSDTGRSLLPTRTVRAASKERAKTLGKEPSKAAKGPCREPALAKARDVRKPAPPVPEQAVRTSSAERAPIEKEVSPAKLRKASPEPTPAPPMDAVPRKPRISAGAGPRRVPVELTERQLERQQLALKAEQAEQRAQQARLAAEREKRRAEEEAAAARQAAELRRQEQEKQQRHEEQLQRLFKKQQERELREREKEQRVKQREQERRRSAAAAADAEKRASDAAQAVEKEQRLAQERALQRADEKRRREQEAQLQEQALERQRQAQLQEQALERQRQAQDREQQQAAQRELEQQRKELERQRLAHEAAAARQAAELEQQRRELAEQRAAQEAAAARQAAELEQQRKELEKLRLAQPASSSSGSETPRFEDSVRRDFFPPRRRRLSRTPRPGCKRSDDTPSPQRRRPTDASDASAATELLPSPAGRSPAPPPPSQTPCKQAPPPPVNVSAWFERYFEARTAAEIFRTWADGWGAEPAPAWAAGSFKWPFEAWKQVDGQSWRTRQLWQKLDQRLGAQQKQGLKIDGTVVVVGAGPVGLRAAVELVSLGAKVTVVDARPDFTRLQRLKLWDWCAKDLTSWGAKLLSPEAKAMGVDPDFCHVGCAELQQWLLKLCLLLGVEVRLGLKAQVEPGSGDKTPVVALSNGERLSCLAVVSAEGVHAQALKAVDMTRVPQKSSQALGIVCHFENRKTAQERDLRQYSWARQFNQPMFEKIVKATGVQLENIVYYKATDIHYLVMTPKKQCLLESGVFVRDLPQDSLCSRDNVNAARLQELVRKVAVYQGLPSECALIENATVVFDFSTTMRCATPAAKRVFFVGDALLEPFWPEGLGVVRGFHSALDASAAIAQLGHPTHGDSPAYDLLSRTFQVLKSLCEATAGKLLQANVGFGTDPKTRYKL